MANIQKNLTFIALLFFILALTVVMCGKVPIKKRSLVVMDSDGGRDLKDQKSRPSKKTFCNAFAGCGGKRSGDGPVRDYNDYDRESVREALDENSRVDDTARDILAEARLWEAFQARNSMVLPMVRRQGFFGREKRAAKHADDTSHERIYGRGSSE